MIDVGTPTGLPPPIHTADEAQCWLDGLLADVEKSLMDCVLTTTKETTDQQRAFRLFLIKYGSALGIAGALFRVERISIEQHLSYVTKVRAVLMSALQNRSIL